MKIASLLLVYFLGLLGAQSSAAQDPVDSAAYLLVIDHSGSMDKKDNRNPLTRWELQVNRAVGFLENMPLESRVWIAVFSEPASKATIIERLVVSGEDRKELIDLVSGWKDDDPRGGTALYDTLEMAFLRAERLSKDNPGRYISVMVYSDGDDSTDPRNTKRKKLQRRFQKIVDGNKNVWMFLTPLVEGMKPPLDSGPRIMVSEPKVAIPLKIQPASLQLASPSLGDLELTLEVMGSDKSMKTLGGANAQIRFEGQGFEASLSPAEFSIEEGPKTFTLQSQESTTLSGDRNYSGRLVITWPEFDKYIIHAPVEIAVGFQKVEPPEITWTSPVSGNAFAAGRVIPFKVESLTGAKVRWDFYGDGSEIGEGHQTSFTYPGAGKYKVGVTVTNPATGAFTRIQLDIEILDLSVTIDPLPSTVFADQEVNLRCTASEGISSFTWWVDGRPYNGKELPISFKEGTHTVQVEGAHPRSVVQAKPLTFQVVGAPQVSLLNPPSGVDIVAGTPYSIKIETMGPLEAIRCVLRNSDTDEEIKEYMVDVERSEAGAPIITKIQHTFAEDGAQRVTVVVEGHMGKTILAGFTLEKSAEVTIVAPKRSVTMVSPASGMRLEVGGEVTFEVEAIGPGVENVRFSAYLDGKGSAFASDMVKFDSSGRARWALPLSADADTRMRVRAETLLAGDIAGPSTEGVWDVVFPELIASMAITGGKRWNDPVKLEIMGEGLTDVHWIYGDGNEERTSVMEASHNYNTWGSLTATAMITGAGGKTRKLERLVEIPYTAPNASISLMIGGLSVVTAEPDDILEFKSDSTGDFVTETWTLDGEPLDPAKGNLIFTDEERGDHTLELLVTGPRGADGSEPFIDRAVLDFRVVRFDHGLFFIGLAALLLLSGFLGRFLLGNGGRNWKVAVACPSGEDFQMSYPVRKYWNRWTKRASLPVFKLLPQAGKEETRNHLLIFKPNTTGGFATMDHSEASKGGDDRGREKFETTQRTLTWDVWDRLNNNLEDFGYEFRVRLERPTAKKSLSGDLVFLTLSSMLALGAAYALYHHVYLSF